jgi:hypothetical protein
VRSRWSAWEGAARTPLGGHRKVPSPTPPDRRQAKAVWQEIVGCRPVDFFKPGALHLLEQLCVMVVAARTIGQIVEENPLDEDAAKVYTSYAQRCAMHCQKLRLSIQSALRTEAGELDEAEPLAGGREASAVKWLAGDHGPPERAH